MTLDQALQIAMQHHQAGRLGEADNIYRQILGVDPNHVDALHMLGVLAAQTGRPDAAVPLISKAVQLDPTFAAAHTNLGNILKNIGRLDEAAAACRRSIELQPNLADPYNILGNILVDQGKTEAAIDAYRRAVQLNANHAAAWHNLGLALTKLRRFDESIAVFQRAISIDPRYADAYSNLAAALVETKQLDQAVVSAKTAIALNPSHADAQNNLGNILREQGQIDQALVAYRRAIELNPQHATAYSNLGNAMREQGQIDQPLFAYRRAIAINPNLASVHSNLAYAVHFDPDQDAQKILEENRRWADHFERPLAGQIAPHGNDLSPDRPLRIGYLSPDFCQHPVGHFLLPLLINHDHQKFKVICYSAQNRPDGLTAELRKNCDEWRDISEQSDEQVAALIRQDGIDILVDLSLHSAANRLLVLARKPAPVQVTWLGYPSTTGLSSIDYRLSDPYIDPPGTDDDYSEKTVRIPTFWCYQAMQPVETVSALPALQNGYVSFACLNNFSKVNPMLLKLWAQVLGRIPSSRLLIHSHEGSHRDEALKVFAQGGVDSGRITFVGRIPTQQYMKQYHQIDIALDTSPYCGGMTTCDALWMGAPVITLRGRTAIGRGGTSILGQIGLNEMIADSHQQYIDIAARLAEDLPRLAQIRSQLRDRMLGSPLMDAKKIAADIETAFRWMWQSWCSRRST